MRTIALTLLLLAAPPSAPGNSAHPESFVSARHGRATLRTGEVEGPPALRVCADPNNLPFSNARGEGFENRIAAVLAKDLGRRVEWVFRPQRRGYFRETLSAGTCDVVMGVPAGFERALTTRPYYRSSYVFVSRRGEGPPIASLDDPRLRTARIGVQLVGDDGINTPPVHALAARGIVDNVVGYTLYGDYREPNPPARVVEAVAKGDVDVAIAWGPLAGWYARRRSPVPLAVAAVPPPPGEPMPFQFAIAVGVARKHPELRDLLQGALDRRSRDIDRILRAYGVPRAEQAP